MLPLNIYIRALLISLTWLGTPINPTAKPDTIRPTSKAGMFFAKPITIQPRQSGTADNCRHPRLPNVSRKGPESNDPIGVAKLWTDAVDNFFIVRLRITCKPKFHFLFFYFLLSLFLSLYGTAINNGRNEFSYYSYTHRDSLMGLNFL